MNNGFRFVSGDDFVDFCAFEKIAFLQRAPFNSPFMAMDKIVERDRDIAVTGEQFARMRANIAGPARYKNRLSLLTADAHVSLRKPRKSILY